MQPGYFIHEVHADVRGLEYFVSDLIFICKVGTIDESPNFQTLQEFLYLEASPISAPILITIHNDAE